MAKLELCRSEIKLEGEAILGIHSNVAGDKYDYTAGHAWVSVENKGAVYYFGLWPDGHPRVSDRRRECSDVRVGMELGAKPLVSRYYALTPNGVAKLNRYLNRPKAWQYTNTCAAWVADLVKEVVGTNLSAIDYAIFSTPRELGRELLKLEKKHPTTRIAPRTGEFPEYNRSWGY